MITAYHKPLFQFCKPAYRCYFSLAQCHKWFLNIQPLRIVGTEFLQVMSWHISLYGDKPQFPILLHIHQFQTMKGSMYLACTYLRASDSKSTQHCAHIN